MPVPLLLGLLRGEGPCPEVIRGVVVVEQEVIRCRGIAHAREAHLFAADVEERLLELLRHHIDGAVAVLDRLGDGALDDPLERGVEAVEVAQVQRLW